MRIVVLRRCQWLNSSSLASASDCMSSEHFCEEATRIEVMHAYEQHLA
jgi:hypothetical protein